MISHLIISIKCFKLNIFIRVFIETGLFIILHSHWWVRVGNIYLGSFEIALIIYISLKSWLSPHSSLLAPLFFIVTHLLLRECSFHHFVVHLFICQWTWPLSVSYTHAYPPTVHYFITYILGLLIFERKLDLCVYTYKPWASFIVH